MVSVNMGDPNAHMQHAPDGMDGGQHEQMSEAEREIMARRQGFYNE